MVRGKPHGAIHILRRTGCSATGQHSQGQADGLDLSVGTGLLSLQSLFLFIGLFCQAVRSLLLARVNIYIYIHS
jgi:hypothetical protein